MEIKDVKKPDYDFYPTPIPVIDQVLREIDLSGVTDILEPGAGNGNVIKALQRYGNFKIDAVEIRPEERGRLEQLGVHVVIDNYMELKIHKKYDLIIGNPPYSYALEFVLKSLQLLKTGGRLVFLLRLSFLASVRRYMFWQVAGKWLEGLYVLHKRPSFSATLGTGRDDYAWFVWRPGVESSTIKVL